MTANVNLWPHTVALIANPDTLADLTPTQRGWIDRAGAEAASRSTDLTDDDAELLLELCAGGARFANASDADLAAMRAGVRAPLHPPRSRPDHKGVHRPDRDAEAIHRSRDRRWTSRRSAAAPRPQHRPRVGRATAAAGGDVAGWYVPVDDHRG